MKKLSLIILLFAATAYADVMYTWTDARGTRHYVSSQDDIPSRYRARAKMYDVATGRKLPLSAAPAATKNAPAGPAGAAVQPPPQPAMPVAPTAPSTPGGAPQPAPQVVQPVQPAPVAPPVVQQAPTPRQHLSPRERRRSNHVHEE